jgi:hypothetical protein
MIIHKRSLQLVRENLGGPFRISDLRTFSAEAFAAGAPFDAEVTHECDSSGVVVTLKVSWRVVDETSPAECEGGCATE